MSETEAAARSGAVVTRGQPGRVVPGVRSGRLDRVGRTARGGAQQASLREHNLSLVLRAIVEAPAPTTRARLASGLGVTRATASDLVDRLIEARLVDELTPELRSGAGRPGMLLAPAARTVVGLGLEVQVDHLAVRATDLTGALVAEARRDGDFRASAPATVLRQVARLAAPIVEGLSASVAIAGACVSVPALLRHGSGVVQLAPNLGWHDVDVLDELARHAALQGFPLMLGNDADLASRAEVQARAAAERTSRDAQSFLYLAGEVGIGGAIVIAGELARGQHGWSGEIGHAVIDRDGPPCGCGAHGCLEQYAGRDVVMRGAGLPLDTPVEALLEAASRPGPARAALESAADAIGVAVATTLNLVDVGRVVLGGIYARLFEHLQEGILTQVGERVLAARWSPVEIGPATAGPGASLAGAGLRVLDDVVAHPSEWIAGH
ncbi:MAG TPA: ROK family transcriptional regulator [Humibacillus xanthopallidus]|nr:ROK family transcriptional regulator [Humibacillus xanthopallidus]